MTALAAIAAAALLTPMEREAGPPHIWMPDDYLALGVEPAIELAYDPRFCPGGWHYRHDWHQHCDGLTLAEVPKLPLTTTWQEAAGAPWSPAYGWAYPDNWRTDSGLWGGAGGWYGGGGGCCGDSDSDTEVAVNVSQWQWQSQSQWQWQAQWQRQDHHHKPPEPAPVPLPGSAWLMLAGVVMLWRMKR